MCEELRNTNPQIIALDYYDGATEGFVINFSGLGSHYFELLLWDDQQDMRVFLMTKSLDEEVNNLRKKLLERKLPANNNSTLIVDEIGGDEFISKKLGTLITAAKQSQRENGFIVSGKSIIDPAAKVFRLTADMGLMPSDTKPK